MRLILIDSSFWIARRDDRDANHGRTVAICKRLFEWRAQLLITPLIFAEVHAHFSRTRRRREQLIRDCWKNPIVRYEEPTFEDQQTAVEILLQHNDKTFSFCDAVSFVLMNRLGVREVVSFDSHFHQYGQFRVIDEKSI